MGKECLDGTTDRENHSSINARYEEASSERFDEYRAGNGGSIGGHAAGQPVKHWDHKASTCYKQKSNNRHVRKSS